MKTKRLAGYGWKPQLPDQRDKVFIAKTNIALPVKVDLTTQMPPVVDQGQLGSCTANAIAGAFGFEVLRQSESFQPLSRLFIYYGERVLEGTVKTDSGAEIRDGIKVIAKQGVCAEILWPYVVSKFAKKPNAKAIKAALFNEAIEYSSIDNTQINNLKSCLAEGYPFVFGFTVYESFESDQVAKTGIAPMPQIHEKVLGGHAVVCVGYDDVKQVFICRNSWGTDWGMSGYFTLPYNYLTSKNLASDFWVIKKVK